uniref:NADH dehydrogenase subunit 4L n=1 Tax=Salganea incerta TaxID=112978 RepID=UPI0027A2D237|nr:NADH dehydrogenase subunit 4L [Salganea incerta]WGO57661.1 NADH dehydrogenase subunit 4L [Salganea incerta]
MMMYISVCFFSGVWVFCSNRKHLLATLLSLEFIVLILYMIMCNYLNEFNYEFFFVMILLTFSVCEGALGLSILVSMIRSYGNDFFNIYSMLEC